MHLNIRSLWHKYDLLKQFLVNSGISVMGLSETWLNENTPKKIISMPDYDLICLDRTWSDSPTLPVKRGGGIGCYIKSDIIYSATELEELNVSSKDGEIMWITINQPNMKKILVCNLYRPPQGNITQFCDIIDSQLGTIANKFNSPPEIFITRDFNVNYKDTQDVKSKALKMVEHAHVFTQYINDFTRYAQNNTCIDLFYTNCKHVMNSGTLDLNMSDHQAIYVTRKHSSKVKKSLDFSGRSYLNFNEETFLDKLNLMDWEPLYQIENVNTAWEYYVSRIRSAIDEMCPIRNFVIKNRKDPWITNEILEEIHDKDRLLHKAKKTGLDQDWINARLARNNVNRNIKQLKSDFISDNLDTHQNEPKKFWKDIQLILPSNKSTSANTSLIHDDNNVPIYDNKEAADFMNNFFINIGVKLSHSFAQPWVFQGIENLHSIKDMEVNEQEVISLSKEIEVTKASAIDHLSSKILKIAFVNLSKQLTFIFNLSFLTNSIPTDWKLSTVTPLPKEGDKTQCTNYRPISLLPLPGKIIEKIVHKRISTFFDDYNILNSNQRGFRKNNSTTNTTAKCLDTIYQSINTRNISIATYIDFSKAFDTVAHGILLEKLKLLGIRGNVLEWLRNYLTNRKQKLILNNTTSDYSNVICGVPQGSVLGPLLFLVYINDLCNVLHNCEAFLYADDTVLVASASDKMIAHRNMQSDLDNITNWCKGNKLAINIKKTKCMLLGSKHKIKKIRPPNINIDTIPLSFVKTYKYLGITVDQTLSFNPHLNQTIKNVAYKICLLSKIRKYITSNAAIQIYKSMVLPVF